MTPLLSLVRRSGAIAAFAKRHQAALQAGAALLAFGLGLWGWVAKEPPGSLAAWFNTLFRTLQLITLQFPTALETDIPWQLQIARFLVPLVAVVATLNIVLGAITRPLRLAALARARDHVVVIAPEAMSRAALEKLAAGGRHVVAVQPDIEQTRRESLEGLGLTVVEADPRVATTLEALGLERAAALFVAGDTDLDNLDIATRAFERTRGRAADLPPLLVGVMLEDEALAAELDAALDGLARDARVRFHRLCPDRDALRVELRRLAPIHVRTDRDRPARLLLIGLSGAWPQVVTQLIVAAQDHPDAAPRLTLILDEAERAAFAAWRADKPDLSLVADIAVLDRPGPALPAPPDGQGAPDLVAILRPDAEAIALALALRRPGEAWGAEAAPIFVRQTRENLLIGRLARAPVPDGRLADIVAFGGIVRADAIERVLDRRGDAIAMALHASYQDATKHLPPASPESIAAWDALPENLRDANRAAAEHVAILAAAAGAAPGTVPDPATLSADMLERLAKIEHRRWMADRIERGWRSGPKRDNALLIHPSIRDWDGLSEAEREKDRAGVRQVLGLAGMPAFSAGMILPVTIAP